MLKIDFNFQNLSYVPNFLSSQADQGPPTSNLFAQQPQPQLEGDMMTSENFLL